MNNTTNDYFNYDERLKWKVGSGKYECREQIDLIHGLKGDYLDNVHYSILKRSGDFDKHGPVTLYQEFDFKNLKAFYLQDFIETDEILYNIELKRVVGLILS